MDLTATYGVSNYLRIVLTIRPNGFRRTSLEQTGVIDLRLQEIQSLRQAGRGASCLDELEVYLFGLKQDLVE